jgi:hypothetical protein
MKTQNQKILAHLKRGRTIQPLQALRLYRCMRLAARIGNIEAMGYEIYHGWVRVRNADGKMVSVRRYSLIR